ncbi:MAG: glutamine-hydrolyzing GMP synthase [Bacteroidales bacterium]|nr:glutamine-hydrolyzing GMP synthase [Bacteroidales bacterium]
MKEKIIILDFGSQYTQLIARRVRELNVYCEIWPFSRSGSLDHTVRGVILSGSPASVLEEKRPVTDIGHIRGKVPLLGICYGAQLLTHQSGGTVLPSKHREYGRAKLAITDPDSRLFRGIENGTQVWMSHGDTITGLPGNFHITGSTGDIRTAAFEIRNEDTFGIQFHPEVHHTKEGSRLLYNFVVEICGCKQEWTPESFIEQTTRKLRAMIGDDSVVLGLSGGVDSSVAAVLLNRAIGKSLTSIFVDNGLLRKNEFEKVLDTYREMGLLVVGVRAGELFLKDLEGLTDPEMKRKSIGRNFIDIFEREARKIRNVKWLAQGTIYPDVIESVSVNGPSVTIKSHHNVGGLPDRMHLRVVEPLKLLFKDEVRRVGQALGIDPGIVNRHPFPGPGLAIRIIGEVTGEKVRLLQEVDDIFTGGLREFNLYDQVWQSAAILLPVRSVGVMGDERTYENVVALRAVTSTDGMTADWAHLPYEFLGTVSNRIINNVKGINRVVYDVSSKPPATIEWE